ncbi:MAG: methylmalonyl Co-A mutase-associated GTPase MeaB [Ignavibacteriales bacterium CG18_big_fil_WC_8_21_14_2_50_31_20]|nr:MAG: methylmalonyl Co-A mutase-associated GTPase MeaB [Ignavibacteriales bacterium CG18_big_fil_WC_8_21_14_2_50_31_20]
MNEKKSYKPNWVPENAGKEFAITIKKGISDAATASSRNVSKYEPTIDEYVDGVLNNQKTLLAKTITLIESNSEKHFKWANEIIQKLLPKAGNSIRVGITGVPGAGKSTFIEALGLHLISKGHKVAVLTVDPSSSITKGSILGDKTRMDKLSREPNCFIRPSPSGTTLGGVTRKSRETITVCEAAGYDVILIETVGVGQNEITVRSMVDFFLLIMISGAGDELQGIKRGVIELADALLINKADGDNKQKAEIAKSEYSNALHYLKPNTEGWITSVNLCSALNNEGITEIWSEIEKFVEITKSSGVFEERRKNQAKEWFNSLIEERLKAEFFNNPEIKILLPKIEHELLNNNISVLDSVEKLFEKIDKNSSNS